MIEVQGVKLRIQEYTSGLSELKGFVGGGIVGALSALSVITPEIAPFGVAAVSAAPTQYLLPTAVGAGLGYLFSPFGDLNVQYLAATLLLLCLRWAFAVVDQRMLALLHPLLGGVAVLGTTAVVAFTQGFTPYLGVLVVAEGITAMTAGYLFTIAYKQIRRGIKSEVGLIAAMISIIILSSGLCRVTIGQLSIGRVLLFAVILGMLYSRGFLMGSTASLIGGAILLCSGSKEMLMATIAGTVVAGAFKGLGKIAMGVSFFITGVATAYLFQGMLWVIPVAIETALGGLLMILLPKSLFGELEEAVLAGSDDPDLLSIAITRLRETASALKEVANVTQKVNHYIGQAKGDDGESLYSQTAELVCKGCPKSAECWQAHFNDTMDGMSRIITAVKAGRKVSTAEFSPEFAGRCNRLPQMVDILVNLTLGYIGRYGMKQQLSCIRSVVTDQFDGVALLLESTAKAMGEISSVATDISLQIKEALQSEGLSPLWVGCYEDHNGLKTVMVKLPMVKLVSALNYPLPQLLEEYIGEPLTRGTVMETEDIAMITYYPKPCFGLVVEGSQRAAAGGRWCGDSYITAQYEGSSMVALSDGMGVGGEAAVDSIMTTTLMSRLYDAGVRPEAALKLINGALLAKEGEERLATVDCCTVNLYSGITEFYKAGAAPSYVLRHGKVITVTSTALPAGILGDVTFGKSSLQLEEGDIIVMVSDGITDGGDGWITSELRALGHLPLKEMTHQILQTAIARNGSLHEDDMSVIGIHIKGE